MEKSIPRKAREILDAIASGAVLQFRRTPQSYFKITETNQTLWNAYGRKTLLASIQTLYQQGLIDIQEGIDGITLIAITTDGRRFSETIRDESISMQSPNEWDRKWRLVMFDIPESKKKSREAFRYHLRRLGFAEFQRSAFLFPFPCANSIEALANRFNVRDHIMMITAESVSNEFHFKKKFGLL